MLQIVGGAFVLRSHDVGLEAEVPYSITDAASTDHLGVILDFTPGERSGVTHDMGLLYRRLLEMC